jgi:hypothetical protein
VWERPRLRLDLPSRRRVLDMRPQLSTSTPRLPPPSGTIAENTRILRLFESATSGSVSNSRMLGLVGIRTRSEILAAFKADPRGISDTQQTIKELFGLAVCPVHVCQRSAHAEAPTSGQSPQELDADGKAADELDRLFDFACELVNTGKDAQIRNILARREASLDRLFDFTCELVNTGRMQS